MKCNVSVSKIAEPNFAKLTFLHVNYISSNGIQYASARVYPQHPADITRIHSNCCVLYPLLVT